MKLSLGVKKGELIAVIGSVGSGKVRFSLSLSPMFLLVRILKLRYAIKIARSR